MNIIMHSAELPTYIGVLQDSHNGIKINCTYLIGKNTLINFLTDK